MCSHVQQEAEREHAAGESRGELRGDDPGDSRGSQQAHVGVHNLSHSSAVGGRAGACRKGRVACGICAKLRELIHNLWTTRPLHVVVATLSVPRYIVVEPPGRGDRSRSVVESLHFTGRLRATQPWGAQKEWESGDHHGRQAQRRARAVRRQQDQPRDRAREPGSRREHHLGHADRVASSSSPCSTASPPSSSTRRSSRSPCRTSKTTRSSTPSPPACCSRPSTSACSATTRPPTS